MLRLNKGHIRIFELIKKDIFGSLSASEKMEFEEWLSKSPENRKFHQKIRNGKAAKEYKNALSKFDMTIGWAKVYKTIIKRERSLRPRSFQRYFKMAAVLVVLITSSIFGVALYKNYQQSQYEAFVSQIEPAAPKATLVFSNKEKITIQGSQNDTLLHGSKGLIHLSNNQLSYYHSFSKKTSEINYNILKVPRGGFFKVILSDSSVVWINSESELKFPEVFTKEQRKVYLTGEAYFDVTSEGRPFIVQFGNKEVEVLGTTFNIESRKNASKDFVTLAEGLVKVTTPFKSVKLHPDHQAVINNEIQEITLKPVDHTLYTDWIRGKIIYKNVSLYHIVEDLERWYDMDIEFEDETTKEIKFSLFVNRGDQVSEIFEILKATDRINFRLSENKIIVTTQ